MHHCWEQAHPANERIGNFVDTCRLKPAWKKPTGSPELDVQDLPPIAASHHSLL
jgi:hypothetical protein